MTPLIWAVESVLSAQPLRSRGTCEATSAMAFGMYPEVSPIIARRINSCQTLVAKASEQNGYRHPQRGAEQHQLAPLAICRATPHRRHNGGDQKRHAERQAGPHGERFMGSDPQLRHIQRQEGQYLADSQSGEEAAEPD